MIMDLYKILGIPYDATENDIKEAYQRMTMRYHPDHNHSEDAREKFKEIQLAYKILSNAEERKQYDKRLFAELKSFFKEKEKDSSNANTTKNKENQANQTNQATMTALIFLHCWDEKIPVESKMVLQKQLEKIDDSSVAMLRNLPLKDPFLAGLLSIFLGMFGVDRFYKGDIGLGITKLLLCWLTLGIWWFIDCFVVYIGVKKDNLEKIMQFLSFAKKKSA